jgi:hypothetical protein
MDINWASEERKPNGPKMKVYIHSFMFCPQQILISYGHWRRGRRWPGIPPGICSFAPFKAHWFMHSGFLVFLCRNAILTFYFSIDLIWSIWGNLWNFLHPVQFSTPFPMGNSPGMKAFAVGRTWKRQGDGNWNLQGEEGRRNSRTHG